MIRAIAHLWHCIGSLPGLEAWLQGHSDRGFDALQAAASALVDIYWFCWPTLLRAVSHIQHSMVQCRTALLQHSMAQRSTAWQMHALTDCCILHQSILQWPKPVLAAGSRCAAK